MTARPWMLVHLELETISRHAAADEDRLRALEVASLEAYRAWLVRVFGFESSIERAVLRIKDLDPSFIEDRLRSMCLREDLRAVGLCGVDIAAEAYAVSVSIDTAAQALGWLYVVERQMLVSGLIRRQLQRVLGDKVQHATNYLSVYGDRPGARFYSFADALSKLARRHPPKLIVAGAVDAYRAQRQWYATTPNKSGIARTPARAVTQPAAAV